ncbi:MAG: FAD-dependent oxidoreductase [Pseudomonadota bacterium]
MTRRRPHFERHNRIAIIGAGPAGIHMASLLKRRGYSNVTVFERTRRIGGKSRTLIKDGIPHELGTCFLSNTYRRVKELVSEYGLRADIPAVGRAIYLDANPPDHEPLELAAFVRKMVRDGGRHRDPGGRDLSASLVGMRLLQAIWRYCRLYRAMFGAFTLPYAMPLSLPSRVLARIDMSFLEFLRRNRLDALTGVVRIAQSAQGYGYLETIPAYYGLCWMTPAFLAGLMRPAIGMSTTTTMLPDGYEALWRTIAEKDGLSINLDTRIHALDRQGADGRVRIDYALNGERQRETYDFLILAFDLRRAATLLRDLTETEQRLFGALEAFTLTATLYEFDPAVGFRTHDDRAIAYFPDALAPGQDHTWYADRNDRQIFAETNGVMRTFECQRRVAYQFSERETSADEPCEEAYGRNATIAAKLRVDWAKRGIGRPRILEQCSWPYFAHFPAWALRQGYPNELFASQGSHHTWYAGASACFESVNHVVNYNHALVDNYL